MTADMLERPKTSENLSTWRFGLQLNTRQSFHQVRTCVILLSKPRDYGVVVDHSICRNHNSSRGISDLQLHFSNIARPPAHLNRACLTSISRTLITQKISLLSLAEPYCHLQSLR